jgi:hypothetical protein
VATPSTPSRRRAVARAMRCLQGCVEPEPVS